jgi:uncharacterized membrane protein YhaH (DUF805 family)
LSGLASFSSRENRQRFWLWILIVYGFQGVVGMLVMIPMMSAWFASMAPMMQTDPERLNAHPEIVIQQMLPFMQQIMVFSAIMAVAYVILVAAAVTRRLHDGDRSGWWASPIFVLHVVGPLIYAAYFPKVFGAMMTSAASTRPGGPPYFADPAFQSMMNSFSWITLVQSVGFLATIALVVLLALPGTVGPNRYGGDPMFDR